MSAKDSERKRNRRIVKEKWLEKLEDILSQIIPLLEQYADGSDSSIRIAAELQAYAEIITIAIEATRKLLEDM